MNLVVKFHVKDGKTTFGREGINNRGIFDTLREFVPSYSNLSEKVQSMWYFQYLNAESL